MVLDFVSALPDTREGVRRLSQVLSGVVVNTRTSEVRKGLSQSFPNSGSYSGVSGFRMLSSDDAQLAQESVDRLAALIALGPSRNARMESGSNINAIDGGGPNGSILLSCTALDSLPEDQAEKYLTDLYDTLLKCRVPEALGELTAMAGSALLGGPNARGGGGGGSTTPLNHGNSVCDEAAIHDEGVRRRSVDLRHSLDMYVRDGGPSPVRASIEGLLCSQKLGGHAQALLESISNLLLSCVFDPIWRHRDLLAQPTVRELVVALSCSSLLPALAHMCVRLRLLLSRPATLEAASYAWMLGFVSRNFTGMCRCMKAIVEFESCGALWAQLGDAFTTQLTATRLVEKFSATAAAVHASYRTWRLPSPSGMPLDMPQPAAVAGGGSAGGVTYLELCASVEVFLEGLFHLTWHCTARAEESAATGPPPPLLVRDVLAAMEPEGSGSVADLLAAAASATTPTTIRSGALGHLSSLLSFTSGPRVLTPATTTTEAPSAAPSTAVACSRAWPGLVSGSATHSLAADWLAHVVSQLDGGELLSSSAGLAPEVAASVPLLHRPGPVDQHELPLLLSVCLAVAAAGAPGHIAAARAVVNGTSRRHVHPNAQPNMQQAGAQPQSLHQQQMGSRTGRNSVEIIYSAVAGVGGGGGVRQGVEGERRRNADSEAELVVKSTTVKHAGRMLRLMARGLKAMASTQDAELAPYPAIHAAHSCAVAMHKILQDQSTAQARAWQVSGSTEDPFPLWNSSAMGPPSTDDLGKQNWTFADPPPKHTALLLDSFQASLLCYSTFLHPDPDKDPLTLKAMERCHEQLLELCTATGDDLRKGVASVVYATHAGLLPALESVLRSAALTCRLETLRVLLEAVLTSMPALQQLLVSRDGYLFLTLRKLIIACINLACPHPLESPMPTVQSPSSRRSLTLILQQCVSGASTISSTTSSTTNSMQHAGVRGTLKPEWAVNGGTAPPLTHAAPADGRISFESTSGRKNRRNSSGWHQPASSRPLILPLAIDLLDTVSMLSKRFIEVHEGRVAAAANIRVDASGNVIHGHAYVDEFHDGDEDEGEKMYREDVDGKAEDLSGIRRRRHSPLAGAAAEGVAENRRLSFEREANELQPLAHLLPFALWWLGGPASDLVDALVQEVINDDGSGSLYGDVQTGDGGSSTAHHSHHPRAMSHLNEAPNSQVSPDRRTSDKNERSPSPLPHYQQQQQYGNKLGSDTRRRQSIDGLRSGLMSARGSVRSGAEDSVPQLRSLPPRFGPWLPSSSGDYSWTVLSRCADTLHTLFRLMVALSDLNRRAPHPDWPALIASLQPQQLLARAVQVLVHGQQCKGNNAAADEHGSSRASRTRRAAFPILLSNLLSASVCGVQYGWLVPESFGIPSATVDPAELVQRLPYPTMAQQSAPVPPPGAHSSGGNGGPVQGPLFSRVRRFTVISANPEGRAYQWAMIGDEDAVENSHREESVELNATSGGSDVETVGSSEEHDVEGGEGGEDKRVRRQRPVVLLQAAAPGGSWANLPPAPGPALVPTRALQMLVWEYGSAADKVLFDLLLRGLSSKQQSIGGTGGQSIGGTGGQSIGGTGGQSIGGTGGQSIGGTGGQSIGGTGGQSIGGTGGQSEQLKDPSQPEPSQFFWVPPSRSLWLRTCSNPCCMNLSGLHEAQMRLAACPRCGQESYCSRHCQAMHWHMGHKTKCKLGK